MATLKKENALYVSSGKNNGILKEFRDETCRRNDCVTRFYQWQNKKGTSKLCFPARVVAPISVVDRAYQQYYQATVLDRMLSPFKE